ncbi:MAG: HD-GYP domain-containing protein [Halioglobus sp.]|nr:HD-GYP domain-containing protein [Halioglobus sp.]
MLKTVKIATSELGLGMFVSGLDRPWLETPFFTQGFLVETEEQLERVRHYCEYVYVDHRRSAIPQVRIRHLAAGSPDPAPDAKGVNRKRIPMQKIFSGRPIGSYQDIAAWDEERPRAREAVSTLREDIGKIYQDVNDGGKLDVIKLRKSVDPVVDSMSRNPDACLWITRLKQHDKYTYQHSLSSSIWAVSIGRQIGLPRHDLRSLAMGAMLMDVGKLRIDSSLLRSDRSLDDGATEALAAHVQHGLDILEDCGVINQDVIDIVAHHHERYDGSGYPAGLKRDKIPAFARIAGIVDTYDALTNQRPHAQRLSPSAATKLLYNERDAEFQAELVEAFIQAVGLYPAGTLVELSSGEVGVVVAEYRTRRLRPKVMVLLDKHKQRLPKSRVLDLYDLEVSNASDAVCIAKSLEPEAYDIDLSQIRYEE